MDEDDDLYGGTAEEEQKPAVKTENEVDMDGEEEEEEESDDVRIPTFEYTCIDSTLIATCRMSSSH